MRKTIAVLGLGKFGRSLAESLYTLGMDLMVVDRDPDVVHAIRGGHAGLYPEGRDSGSDPAGHGYARNRRV